MGGRVRTCLFGLALAAVAAAGPAPARAEDTIGPIGPQAEAVRDLWAKVKAKCVTPGAAPFEVDNVGISAANSLATESLRNLQRAKLDAAFADLFAGEATGRTRAFDIVDRDTLRAHVTGDAFGDNPTVRRHRDTYLMATADISSDSAGRYLLQVSVRGLGEGGGRCYEVSDHVVLPEEQVGESVVSLNDIFLRAAREMLRRTRGSTTLYLSAEVAGEGAAPSRWTDAFVEETRVALQAATEDQAVRNLARQMSPIIVQPEADAGTPAGERWESAVKVERRKNTYRIVITVNESGGYIVERGLVPSDALPPVPLEQLETVSYQGETGRLLEMADDRQLVDAPFRHGTDVHDYTFRLRTPEFVEFDVADALGGEAPAVALYGGDGAVVDPIAGASRSPTIRRYRLDAGVYRLRVQNAGAAGDGYQLAYRGAPTALQPLMPAGARVTRVFGDWQVGVTEERGERACFAVSEATGWGPAGWRPIRPFIWFLVPDAASSEGAEAVVNQRFDLATYYDPARPLSGAVYGRTGDWPVPLGVNETQIQSLEDGDAMSVASLEGMTQGELFVISGTTRDGRPAQVDYSLRGYQAAINEILSVCNRRELRDALIRR